MGKSVDLFSMWCNVDLYSQVTLSKKHLFYSWKLQAYFELSPDEADNLIKLRSINLQNNSRSVHVNQLFSHFVAVFSKGVRSTFNIYRKKQMMGSNFQLILQVRIIVKSFSYNLNLFWSSKLQSIFSCISGLRSL